MKAQIRKYSKAARPCVDKHKVGDKSREDLIREFAPMIKYVADRMTMRLPSGVSREDLLSAGVLGLNDAINKFKEQGNSLRDSIIMAGENRIRPIIMTSITTILALLPLTIGFGESAALRAPMAIAVIAGLVTSTLLTLVVIPCVYYVFDNMQTYLSQLRTKRAKYSKE